MFSNAFVTFTYPCNQSIAYWYESEMVSTLDRGFARDSECNKQAGSQIIFALFVSLSQLIDMSEYARACFTVDIYR